MTNLVNFYTTDQALSVIGINYRMQLHRILKKNPMVILSICGKTFYLKESVNSYVESRIKTKNNFKERIRFEKAKYAAVSYDIDLNKWIPRCEALEVFGYSHELMYLISPTRTSLPNLRTKFAYGQHWFLRSDLERMSRKNRDKDE